jgi:hypothetical protein
VTAAHLDRKMARTIDPRTGHWKGDHGGRHYPKPPIPVSREHGIWPTPLSEAELLPTVWADFATSVARSSHVWVARWFGEVTGIAGSKAEAKRLWRPKPTPR